MRFIARCLLARFFLITGRTLQVRLLLVAHLSRLHKQRTLVNLERHEILFVELLVVIVAKLPSEQFEVGLADDNRARHSQ